MILGIGTDMVEIGRMEKACRKKAFVLRIFSEEECRQAKGRASALAGNFAVKESVAKALGTGFRSFTPKDIQVLRDDMGKPWVKLEGGARKRAQAMGVEQIHASITNTRELAVGFAVAEGKTGEVLR